MKDTISVGKRVVLLTFNGLESVPTNVDEHENFWKLVGRTGEVLSIDRRRHVERNRVLVGFDVDLDELDLPNHNQIPNSLWIRRSDLAVLD